MKYLSILFAAALISIAAKAQDHKFELGLTGGGDISWVENEAFDHYPLGWSAGLNAQFNWTERFALNTKFLYHEMIVKTENSSGNFKMTMKSFAIPFTARYMIGQSKLKVLLDAGLQYTRGYREILDSEFVGGVVEVLNNPAHWHKGALVFGTGAKYAFTDRLSGTMEARLVIHESNLTGNVYSENSQLFFGITYGL
ncbi:outer membrane beta-barrel protein [bacterium SCSIO 12643]|nr:outer membrane beta-barrel protein [bacterium SCSIO 12643]